MRSTKQKEGRVLDLREIHEELQTSRILMWKALRLGGVDGRLLGAIQSSILAVEHVAECGSR